MSREIVIANPIYDVVFKHLMEDTKNARFFIETLLGQEVEEIQFKPQEYTLPKKYQKRLSGQDIQLPGAMKVLRLDFVATIKNADGTVQKVLIEVQKGKKNIDIERFRDYLAEHYKRTDEVQFADGIKRKTPLHIITIYILAFDLPHIKTPAVKIGRDYIDLITKKKIRAKEDFAEQLTHDCIIIQTGRIKGSVKTELDALLSIFEQRYFLDDKGHLKQYSLPVESKSMRHLTDTLVNIAASPDGRKALEVEESIRRLVEGDYSEEMIKIRHELAQKDKALSEKDKALANQAKEIAELKAKLSGKS